jgi:hypothetical protein
VSTIKPNDLAVTPTGRTVRCEDLNPDGSRAVIDIVTGDRFDLLPQHLKLLVQAPILPWKTRLPR